MLPYLDQSFAIAKYDHCHDGPAGIYLMAEQKEHQPYERCHDQVSERAGVFLMPARDRRYLGSRYDVPDWLVYDYITRHPISEGILTPPRSPSSFIMTTSWRVIVGGRFLLPFNSCHRFGLDRFDGRLVPISSEDAGLRKLRPVQGEMRVG
jgi:hypothetical protein